MSHKRKEFTDNQKAEIFVRDKATCALSGISLWLLDNGIKSNWQIDWVDHIKPSASGGSNDLENGICASNLFNSKKKDNAHDNIYFFKNGNITEHYVRTFGNVTEEITERFSRLKKLQIEDWFFNRSIARIFTGYDCRCDKEFKNIEYKRTDEYWFKSSWNALEKYHKKKGEKNILERELVKEDIPFGTEKLIKLDIITDKKHFSDWIEENYSYYRESYKALYEYFEVNNMNNPDFIKNLKTKNNLHPEIIKSLTAHNNGYK